MAINTDIEWADSVLNLQMGCDGCELWNRQAGVEHCYAGTLTDRYGGRKGWPNKFEDPALFPERLAPALRWRDLTGTKRPDKPWLDGLPRIVFLNDMGDTFTESLPLDWLAPYVPELASSPHQWLLLTKRPKRLAEFSREHPLPSNVWPGTSITSAVNIGRVDDLLAGWPMRVGNMLFAVENGVPRYFSGERAVSSFFAWIGRQLASEGQNRLRWTNRGDDKVDKSEFFEATRAAAAVVDAVETHPHFPEIPGHYYCKTDSGRRTKGKAMEGLLDRFCPAHPVDRDYIRAFIASLFWGGPLGQRPAWLFTADESAPKGGRGVGKSLVAVLASELVGGHLLFSSRDDIKDIQNRVLSPVGRAKRVAIIDNVKTPKFSWAHLEAFITTRYFSGKEMYTGEGQRPNTINWVITFNGPSMSTDLAQRSIIIKLKKATYTATWYEDILAYIQSNRAGLIDDVATLLTAYYSPCKVVTRWGACESQVLAHCTNDLERCQKELLARQREVDQDADDADMVREEVIRWLNRSLALYNPDTAVVAFTPDQICDIYCASMREHLHPKIAGSRMALLGIEELRPDPSRKNGRGWIWRGSKAGKRQAPVEYQQTASRPRLAGSDEY